jgi:xylan 1,4-beta-xylosidase
LSDDFIGNKLGLQWKFFGEYDTSRLHLADKSLVMKGKGNGVGNSFPLLFVPSKHTYTAEVEMEIEGNAVGALRMFYYSNAHSGILADKENIQTKLRGWQFISEPKVIKNHFF